jgi:hypothetical protein
MFGTQPPCPQPRPLLDQTTVNVETLNDTVSGPVDMAKIDVEGFEADVTASARNLTNTSPNMSITFEINSWPEQTMTERVEQEHSWHPSR